MYHKQSPLPHLKYIELLGKLITKKNKTQEDKQEYRKTRAVTKQKQTVTINLGKPHDNLLNLSL